MKKKAAERYVQAEPVDAHCCSRKAKVRKGLARKSRRVLARKTARYGKSKKAYCYARKEDFVVSLFVK